MGKKYVIELCEKPMKNENGNDIWRVKGFNTLVFDQNGLDKLEEYKEYKTTLHVGCIYEIKSSHKRICITKIINSHQVFYMFDDGGFSYSFLPCFAEDLIYLGRCNDINDFLKKGDFT